MRPPVSRKCRITSVQLSRASMSSPTLKVRELPRPITGMASPLEGIGLLMSCSRLAAGVAGRRVLAQSAASILINSRRESRSGKVITATDSLLNGSRQVSQVYSSCGLAGDPASRTLLHLILAECDRLQATGTDTIDASDIRTYLIIPRGRDRGDFGSWRDAASAV